MTRVISMKDYIERALISTYISLLLTRGLFVIAMADVEVFAKSIVILMLGFLTALFWMTTILTIKKIVSRTPPKDIEPLWLSKVRGVKRLVVLALLASSSIAATYLLILGLLHLSDAFEILLYVYIVFMMWFIFALEVAYTKTLSRNTQNTGDVERR